MNKFVKFPGFRDKVFTTSYDDGVYQDKRLIDIMKKHGLKGTFNLNSGYAENNLDNRHMNCEELVETFKDSGMEVAVHGHFHWPFDGLDVAVTTNEILKDRQELEKIFDTIIRGAAYPFGTYDENSINILKCCGIKYCRTAETTESFELPKDWLKLAPTCRHINPKLMELAKEFVEYDPSKRSWPTLKMFYVWGHSYEFDNDKNWNVFEELAEFIGNREDIWYATNIEIYDYIKAAEQLIFSASGDACFNPTSTPIYVKYFRRKIVVNPGETVKFMDYPENV